MLLFQPPLRFPYRMDTQFFVLAHANSPSRSFFSSAESVILKARRAWHLKRHRKKAACLWYVIWWKPARQTEMRMFIQLLVISFETLLWLLVYVTSLPCAGRERWLRTLHARNLKFRAHVPRVVKSLDQSHRCVGENEVSSWDSVMLFFMWRCGCSKAPSSGSFRSIR